MQKKGKAYLEQTFAIELASLQRGWELVDEDMFIRAVAYLRDAKRIGATGCGNSGIACQHFAHLMCCIEQPARFISPAEAPHGEMGFLWENDAMVFLSRGGKTKELIEIAQICRKRGVRVITITENVDSELAKLADAVLQEAPVTETDPFNSQGTTSTTLACMLFHALQRALMEETGFRIEQFAQIHPEGAVGERLQTELK